MSHGQGPWPRAWQLMIANGHGTCDGKRTRYHIERLMQYVLSVLGFGLGAMEACQVAGECMRFGDQLMHKTHGILLGNAVSRRKYR